jgi:hypothetical protein
MGKTPEGVAQKARIRQEFVARLQCQLQGIAWPHDKYDPFLVALRHDLVQAVEEEQEQEEEEDYGAQGRVDPSGASRPAKDAKYYVRPKAAAGVVPDRGRHKKHRKGQRRAEDDRAVTYREAVGEATG